MRIAVFLYGYTVHSHSRDLILYLANEGYFVTVFVDKKSLRSGLIEVATLDRPNIELIELHGNNPWPARFLPRLAARLFGELQIRLGGIGFLFDRRDLYSVKRWLRANSSETLALIGVEKLGLIMAGWAGRYASIPFVYHSLELFLSGPADHWLARARLTQEADFHRHAAATIIQDELRASVLFNHNEVVDQPLILMPVGAPNVPPRGRNRLWHRMFSLPEDHKVFLYFGDLTSSWRALDKLVHSWRRCPEDFVLVMHGNGDSSTIKDYCDRAKISNVFISTTLVPEDQVTELIAGADCGICIYRNDSANNRLTAFSSQKLALYLREAVPIITACNESYDRLFSRFDCGSAVNNYDEIAEAATIVLGNWASMSEQARCAFETIYATSVTHPRLKSFLNTLTCGNSPSTNLVRDL